ncbi:MAG TPA: acyltransferase family protein [Acidimicrobiia bacterium]
MATGEATKEGTTARTARGSRLTYRPHLDGLRTVAVYLVVAFHAGLGWFRGGFIGVDVFFVLSGFLVTSILMRDLVGIGRVDRRRFYARRVRRILPAALVTLIVTAVVYSVVATPAESLDVLGGFRAACLYVANWFFIRQSADYFGGNINASPVVHFWSLAVEEQFYLLWPLALGALFVATRRVGRYRWWIIRAAVLGATAASAIEAWHIGSTNLNRAYFGTDARAYQLLAGAVLALTPQLLRLARRSRAFRRWISSATAAGLIVVGSSMFDMSPITRGFFAAALAAMLIVALEPAGSGLVRRVLSSPPFTYLGRLSYSTYLWHWPVIVLVSRNRHLSPFVLFAIACSAATTLAALSFHLMEHPVRASRILDRLKGPVIVTGFTASLIVGLLLVPTVLEGEAGSAQLATSGGSSERLLDWRVAKNDFPPLPDCVGAPVERCTVVRGTKERVLLIGDSHAHMWLPALEQIARTDSLTLSVVAMDACPWPRGLLYTITGPFEGAQKAIDESCKRHQADWYDRVLPQLHPDIVVVAQPGFDEADFMVPLIFPGGRRLAFGDPDYEQSLIDTSAATLRIVRARVPKVVFIEPLPGTYPFNPLSCLSKGGSAAQCAHTVNAKATQLELYFRMISRQQPNTWSLDLDRLVCPRLPTCDAVVGNVIVRLDANSHLTATFARSVAPAIDRLLHSRGVLRRS